jgi:processive 1,2-diacylglycerol beta-glucosyltransferase
MKKILILTAGFGDGHNAAARNLRDVLESLTDEIQVEVLDLFEASYGSLNSLLKKTYLGMVRYAPGVWGNIYSLLENCPKLEKQFGRFGRMQQVLGEILRETEPDCVVSTYPVYAHLIEDLFRDHSDRGFRLITIITDSMTVNPIWFRAPSDLYCVPNPETKQVLVKGGVDGKTVEVTGFPVSPDFAERQAEMPAPSDEIKLLYCINTGKKKAGRAILDLLEIPRVKLTVTAGKDADLKAKLLKKTEKFRDRVEILGWTNQMPKLMMSHHLFIGKAGGATVQETLAAECPMIINQVIPGQEEGNAEVIRRYEVGAVARDDDETVARVAAAFAGKSEVWKRWKANLTKVSRPAASIQIAQRILERSRVARAVQPKDATVQQQFRRQRLRAIPEQRSFAAGNAPLRSAHSYQLLGRKTECRGSGRFLRPARL